MNGPDYAQMLMLLKTLERRVYEYALSRSEREQIRLESAVREARENSPHLSALEAITERIMKARDTSFDITWRDGAYYVSIPNLNHETVVPLATAEALEAENAKLQETEKELRCALLRVKSARSLLEAETIAEEALKP